jgi:secondary thiamine-phosphate synthase enzyme
MFQRTITLTPGARGLWDLTDRVAAIVADSGVTAGLCHLFVQHTSASLIVQENASPDVLHDLDDWLTRAAPDGDPRYRHDEEGPDDMSGHIRSAITATSVTVPIVAGKLGLGRWQAIYLAEHRTKPLTRNVIVTVQG